MCVCISKPATWRKYTIHSNFYFYYTFNSVGCQSFICGLYEACLWINWCTFLVIKIISPAYSKWYIMLGCKPSVPVFYSISGKYSTLCRLLTHSYSERLLTRYFSANLNSSLWPHSFGHYLKPIGLDWLALKCFDLWLSSHFPITLQYSTWIIADTDQTACQAHAPFPPT